MGEASGRRGRERLRGGAVVGRKIMDKFDNGELYQQLMDEILSISNVAYLTQTMEPHLKERLKKSSKNAIFMLSEEAE
jgi:hypothetical protein